jgi:hypothetical protein
MTVIVALAMLADFATFALAVPSVGIAAEQNPLMAAAYANVGILAVAALKLACTVAIVAALRRIHRPPLRRLTATFAAGVGLLGVLGNVTAWRLA